MTTYDLNMIKNNILHGVHGGANVFITVSLKSGICRCKPSCTCDKLHARKI